MLITSLSGMLSTNKTNNSKLYRCRRCLYPFREEQKLNNHQDFCKQFKGQKIEMPKNTHTYFDNFDKMVKCPVEVYADFEAVVVPNDDDSEGGSTKKTTKHVPCAYALKVSSRFEEWDLPVEHYRNPDAAEHFILRLHEIYEQVSPLLYADKKMEEITQEKRGELDNQTECYLCLKPFKRGDTKHIDHCHYTGKIFGYAHSVCNQRRKTDKRLPVVFHNFKGYDCHMLIRDLCANEVDLNKLKLIPKTMDKYTSVSTPRFRFIDSYQHLPSKLDTLVEDLKDDGDNNFSAVKEYVDLFWGGDRDKYDLLLRKGVYPYSYMNSHDRFKEGLPSIDKFFDDLNDEPCSRKDYQHVKKVWEKFGLKNLGELCDLYVTSDVLLLSFVFRKYRKECLENFELDPIHYYTTPGN